MVSLKKEVESVVEILRGRSQAEIDTILEQVKQKFSRRGFPISIVNAKVTVLQAVVKYLRENKEYSFKEIAEILGRNEKNIWIAYDTAKKKMPVRFEIVSDEVYIPFEVFRSNYSPLESVVVYLKKKMSLHEIGQLLERDDRTIWTVYNRAMKKDEK
ncbi:MAG: hypothetical protein ABIJ18_02730 [archaeon]